MSLVLQMLVSNAWRLDCVILHKRNVISERRTSVVFQKLNPQLQAGATLHLLEMVFFYHICKNVASLSWQICQKWREVLLTRAGNVMFNEL